MQTWVHVKGAISLFGGLKIISYSIFGFLCEYNMQIANKSSNIAEIIKVDHGNDIK